MRSAAYRHQDELFSWRHRAGRDGDRRRAILDRPAPVDALAELADGRYVGCGWRTRATTASIRRSDVDNIHLRIGNDVYVFIQKTYELGSPDRPSSPPPRAAADPGASLRHPLPLLASISFPGYLIVAAFLYAMCGTLVAHLVGRPLIPLNFQQQRYEAVSLPWHG
jgi:hypothetical protein